MATLRALAPANPRDLRDNWIDLDQSLDRSIYNLLSVLVRSMPRNTTLTLLPSRFSKDIPFERKLEQEAREIGRRDFTVRFSIDRFVRWPP